MNCPTMSYHLHHLPRPSDLASAWMNDLPVVATPMLLWLVEMCSMGRLALELGHGEMSISVGHEFRHVRPAMEGLLLDVEARLESLQPPLALLEVKVTQNGRPILVGRHTRAIIRREPYMARLEASRLGEKQANSEDPRRAV